MMESVSARLRGYLPPGELERTDSALQAIADEWPAPLEPLLAWARSRGLRVPPTVLPVGIRGEQLFALDLSFHAADRKALPVLTIAEGHWWRLAAATPADLAAGIPPSDEAEVAWTFRGAARLALATADPQEQASRLCTALLRPMYTAESLDQVTRVTSALIARSQELGVDPHALRLAHAGACGEQWRLVAAERAIAGRVREALVGYEGALVLGASPALCHRVMERLFNRMGWGFATRLLRVNTLAS